MTQVRERPTKVEERKEVVEERRLYSPFVRWLGWLLVSVIVVGGAWLIWDNFISDGVAEVATAPALAEIDLHANPELKAIASQLLIVPRIDMIDPHESPEVMRVPMALSLRFIDPHENPEVGSAPFVATSAAVESLTEPQAAEVWGTVDLAEWDLLITNWRMAGPH